MLTDEFWQKLTPEEKKQKALEIYYAINDNYFKNNPQWLQDSLKLTMIDAFANLLNTIKNPLINDVNIENPHIKLNFNVDTDIDYNNIENVGHAETIFKLDNIQDKELDTIEALTVTINEWLQKKLTLFSLHTFSHHIQYIIEEDKPVKCAGSMIFRDIIKANEGIDIASLNDEELAKVYSRHINKGMEIPVQITEDEGLNFYIMLNVSPLVINKTLKQTYFIIDVGIDYKNNEINNKNLIIETLEKFIEEGRQSLLNIAYINYKELDNQLSLILNIPVEPKINSQIILKKKSDSIQGFSSPIFDLALSSISGKYNSIKSELGVTIEIGTSFIIRQGIDLEGNENQKLIEKLLKQIDINNPIIKLITVDTIFALLDIWITKEKENDENVKFDINDVLDRLNINKNKDGKGYEHYRSEDKKELAYQIEIIRRIEHCDKIQNYSGMIFDIASAGIPSSNERYNYTIRPGRVLKPLDTAIDKIRFNIISKNYTKLGYKDIKKKKLALYLTLMFMQGKFNFTCRIRDLIAQIPDIDINRAPSETKENLYKDLKEIKENFIIKYFKPYFKESYYVKDPINQREQLKAGWYDKWLDSKIEIVAPDTYKKEFEIKTNYFPSLT